MIDVRLRSLLELMGLEIVYGDTVLERLLVASLDCKSHQRMSGMVSEAVLCVHARQHTRPGHVRVCIPSQETRSGVVGEAVIIHTYRQ